MLLSSRTKRRTNGSEITCGNTDAPRVISEVLLKFDVRGFARGAATGGTQLYTHVPDALYCFHQIPIYTRNTMPYGVPSSPLQQRSLIPGNKLSHV